MDIAEFLHSEFRRTGMMPTRREIAERFGFSSPNAVRSHLRLMENKGMLTRMPGKARGLTLSAKMSDSIPLLGQIKAGAPEEALESVDELVPLPGQFFHGTHHFALRVRGDSMAGVGILSGDIAILNWQQDVADGDIAAVLLDDDATLKFLHRADDCVVLRGANPKFPDILVRSNEARSVRVIGRYVGLIRRRGGPV